jgi:threonine/homoserine/homoserine lactone efflux protein
MSLSDLGLQHVWVFVFAAWALNLTPGPDVFYMVTSTLRGGFRSGLVAIAGVLTGCLVHVAAATVGISALVAASATAFMVLKWVGAAYLLYIGFKMLTSKASAVPADGDVSRVALRTVFVQGFWSNALNPKVALFFLAFLPQFIAPNAAHPTLGFLTLGLMFIANSIPIMLGFVALAAWASQRLSVLQRGLSWIERAAGALFIGFGLKLALSER